MIASSEADITRDHGTLQERTDSAEFGLAHGLSSCSRYVPATPLVT